MCNSKISLTCKSANLMLVYITGLSFFYQAQRSWGGHNVIRAHVKSFTLPGKLKRCFNMTENSGWMAKHTGRKCWFKKCQGTSFHCPQGKPTEQVRLWRSVPPAPLLPKRTRGRFFILLGTDASLPTKIYNLVLCFWNDCMQPLHHAGGDAPAALQPHHSTIPRTHRSSAHPHRFSSSGHSQRNYTAVGMQSHVIRDTWRIHKKIIHFLLNKQPLSTQKPQSAPALLHIGITVHQSHPTFSLCCFILLQHLQISTGEYGNPKTLLPHSSTLAVLMHYKLLAYLYRKWRQVCVLTFYLPWLWHTILFCYRTVVLK